MCRLKSHEDFVVSWKATNGSKGQTFKDVMIHCVVVAEKEPGQLTMPSLKDPTQESALTMDFKPGSAASGKFSLAIDEPGFSTAGRNSRDAQHARPRTLRGYRPGVRITPAPAAGVKQLLQQWPKAVTEIEGDSAMIQIYRPPPWVCLSPGCSSSRSTRRPEHARIDLRVIAGPDKEASATADTDPPPGGRMTPPVFLRDGLKPVHRRILYAMFREGLLSSRRYSKCAGVVGEVLKVPSAWRRRRVDCWCGWRNL